jgi:hypothetical protein
VANGINEHWSLQALVLATGIGVGAVLGTSLMAWAQTQGPNTDVVGSFVTGIQGWAVAAQPPANGQVLKWNAATKRYIPAAP